MPKFTKSYFVQRHKLTLFFFLGQKYQILHVIIICLGDVDLQTETRAPI